MTVKPPDAPTSYLLEVALVCRIVPESVTWKGPGSQLLVEVMSPDSELLVTALLFEPFELWWAGNQEPALRERPLVSIRNERVLHANPIARQEGITPGLSLAAARLKTSNLHAIDAEAERLGQQWTWQLEQLNGWSPWLHSPSVGRAWLLVQPGEVKRLALEYSVQAGAASNQELALAAALVTAPGQHRFVPAGQERNFLARVPVGRLPALGFKERSAQRFAWLGIHTLGDLFHWKESQLRSIAGDEASQLHRLLHGPWETQVARYQPEPTLESSYSFDHAVSEPFELEPVVRLLARRLERKLAGQAAGRVIVTTHNLGLRLPDEVVCKEPVQAAEVLVRLIWRSLTRSGAAALGVEQLSVTLAGLSRPEVQQGLWPQKEARERAIRLVSRRFPGALMVFELVDSYSLARDRRYRLLRLDTGEAVTPAGKTVSDRQVKHEEAELQSAGAA